MDLFQADLSVDQSGVALIDWNTPPMIKNNERECINNNPFDIMESKASNMDPFDLVFNETLTKRELPCNIILSPLCDFKSKPLRKSKSLTDINGVAKLLDNVNIDKSNEDYNTLVCLDEEVVDQSKKNCNSVLIEDNKIIENEENKIESGSAVDQNDEIDIEKNSLCNEDEKKQIREQTRLRIQMLIEKGKKDYEEEYSRKSLFCTPLRNHNSSFNKSESLFNRGFLQNGSNIYDDNSNKIPENTARSNDSNNSNFNSLIHESKLNSFDLNSLKPEWVNDNFSDSDGSMDTQTNDNLATHELIKNNNNDIDTKLKALNRIGIIESKLNACRGLKFTQNKKPQNKGPFLANVPLQQMVQNFKDEEIKESIHASSPSNQIKPVASSTPTTDTIMSCKTPSINESSIKSGGSISRRTMLKSVPSTPLNVTKCVRKYSISDADRNKLSNVSYSTTPNNKRSNTTIVLFDGANERKLKMAENVQSYKLNKSKSLSKIGKIPMALNTNKISGLPVPTKFSNSISMPFKGKENMKPQ